MAVLLSKPANVAKIAIKKQSRQNENSRGHRKTAGIGVVNEENNCWKSSCVLRKRVQLFSGTPILQGLDA